MRMSSSTSLPSSPASMTATETDALADSLLAMTKPAVPALLKRNEIAAQFSKQQLVTGERAHRLAKREL